MGEPDTRSTIDHEVLAQAFGDAEAQGGLAGTIRLLAGQLSPQGRERFYKGWHDAYQDLGSCYGGQAPCEDVEAGTQALGRFLLVKATYRLARSPMVESDRRAAQSLYELAIAQYGLRAHEAPPLSDGRKE